MILLLLALVPTAALVAGTMASPAVPFSEAEDLDEYMQMQDSYRSDDWQAPRKWERMGVPRPLDSERPDGTAYPSQGPPDMIQNRSETHSNHYLDQLYITQTKDPQK